MYRTWQSHLAISAAVMGLPGVALWLPLLVTPAPAVAGSPPQVNGAAAVNAMQLLEESLRRSDALDGYTIIFYERERRGMLNTLSPWEHVQVEYRKNPKAVKMVWFDPNSEYAEALYVEGRNNDEMKVLPRHRFLGFAPQPFWTNPQNAVSFGKTLWPITDIGLAELIHVTFRKMQQAEAVGPVTVMYAGQSSPPDLHEPADHIVIVYPKGYGRAQRQDVYISKKSGYPIATYLWQPDGKLLAAYLYGTPEPTVPPLSEFQISGGKTVG